MPGCLAVFLLSNLLASPATAQWMIEFMCENEKDLPHMVGK